MSDIERFFWASVVTPAANGDWVRYTDHQAEVEQLTRQRSENFAEIERLTRTLDRLRDGLREALEERNNVRHEAVELREKLVEAQAEVERLKEQVAALTVAVEKADEAKADAEAAAATEETETDRVMAERDAAQAEVERLTAERDQTANRPKGREVGRVGLDHAYINAIPPPRPTDEDIWREVFVRHVFDHDIEKLMGAADLALSLYRTRWPR